MSANALAQRIITAAALIALCLPTVLYLPLGVSLGLLGGFVVAAAWEWSAFSTPGRQALRLAYTAAILGGLLAAVWATRTWLPVLTVIKISLIWWLSAFVWILLYPTRIPRVAVLVCGFLVLIPAGISLQTVILSRPLGRLLLLLALAIVWAADVGAYFAGRMWGRVKLAPNVSPGKTWEGVFGGVVLAVLTAMAGAALLGYPALAAAPLGLSVAAISVIGDLTISMFKRNSGLKDSGRLFPGHGGVLDRVDSLTAAAPLFLLEAWWLDWVSL